LKDYPGWKFDSMDGLFSSISV